MGNCNPQKQRVEDWTSLVPLAQAEDTILLFWKFVTFSRIFVSIVIDPLGPSDGLVVRDYW